MKSKTIENKNAARVNMEQLKGLTTQEQVSLLLEHGYIVGTSHPSFLTPDEWALFKRANDEGHIVFEDVNLYSCDKVSIPFVLKSNKTGDIIDAYNHVVVDYYPFEPPFENPKTLLRAWIHGTCPEEALVMDTSGKGECRIDYAFPPCVFPPKKDFIISKHDIECLEFIVFHKYKKEIGLVIPLSTGRYALANFAPNTIPAISWTGLPVCGDGNMESYARRLLKCYEFFDTLYNAANDSGNSFATAIEAREYASRLGIDVVEITE